MESPSSTRRITRSQTRAALGNSATSNNNISRKMEDSENSISRTKERNAKQDRSPLIDITNDSPIVGLATGSLETPISLVSRQMSNRCKMTPGSGEALLRSQVKTLLQRVEEEADISKFSLGSEGGPIPKSLKAFLNSPAGLLAPTPANTPQVLNFLGFDEFGSSLGSVSRSPIQDELSISQVVSGIFDEKKQTESGSECEQDLISRTLFLDFSEKSDSSSDCSSAVTYQGTGVGEEAENECKPKKGAATFMGKRTRFVYNSDDELVEDNEEFGSEEGSSGVLRLKGLPTPKGKHLRFQDEEEQ
ncbi:hypothetical protein Cgig2_007418 [Carnegiea gigantea]|uniref:Uncharacterized protein n=1 Tax=Carnegiea gigantea TaxID=171969 RepID=A0A9Q1QTP4_9CARY|nr:hypothetical protein Cgig2_007418 [Carnegiea gigantea]